MSPAQPPVNTTCPYCGVGCGVRAQVDGQRLVAVSGDPDHPANAGRLCVKGSTLADTQRHDGRLLEPHVDGAPVSWEVALDRVAGGLARVIGEYGPDAVAMYLSGQLLTEDYYVANKLMKGFLGSGNVDTNSRLCMASAVAAHKRAFGEDVVPCDYTDLEQCRLLVLVGSNLAWAHPVLFQRIADRKTRGELRVVVVDPRRTATCDIADLHLAIRPGSDVALFNALLAHLAACGAVDGNYLSRHTTGFEAALASARVDADRVLETTGVAAADLETLFHWFADTPRTVTLFSQGVNQSESGTDKANAIINCHLASGRIGRAGMGPFSVTGQPNAMGGREVGGMANQLAAHGDFDPDDLYRVRRFWNAPNLVSAPGRKAVDLFDAVARGEIRAVWIMGTNPVVSLPGADSVREALARCPLVVVSDCVARTDTTACADVLLPAAGWGEKDGTVTNSERCISRQRAFLPAPGLARPDWWSVCQVARRLGFGRAFDYTGPHEIFREHSALSGFENGGRRQFDIGALAHLSDQDYDTLGPVRWPLPAEHAGASRPFADGRFSTADGRARLVAVAHRPPGQRTSAARGFVLNTGRLRDQWHTMTRTGVAPRLFGHSETPAVHLHPVDARSLDLADGDLAEISNDGGRIRAIVETTTDLRPGEIFVPMHWNDRFASLARVSSLIAPMVDPLSGQPESKHGAVAVAACPVAAWVRVASRVWLPAPLLEPASFWTRLPAAAGYRYELAFALAADAEGFLEQLGSTVDHDNAVSYLDRALDDRRLLLERDGTCMLAAFCHRRRNALPAGSLVAGIVADPASMPPWRRLAGAAAADADHSRIVCTCFGVSEQAIRGAVVAGARSPEGLGRKLRCGTNCGSCVPELRTIIDSVPARGAA